MVVKIWMKDHAHATCCSICGKIKMFKRRSKSVSERGRKLRPILRLDVYGTFIFLTTLFHARDPRGMPDDALLSRGKM